MNPRVGTVVATDDHKLILTFTNHETRLFDCVPLLDFGVFRRLRDIVYFKRVAVVDGTVVWPDDQDICPDTLYQDSVQAD